MKKKLITYYLTLSQMFPSTHCRAGEPTYFLEKMHNALTEQDFSLHPTGREDSMLNIIIYPSHELIEQMKRDYLKWLDQMLGGIHPSDWTSQDKPKK